MTQPKLAVAGSGYGGRGYRQLFTDDSVVPSITTCLGAVGDPKGLIHWNVEQTALYAVTHIDDLLNRTEEAGVRYLQYVTKQPKAEVLDDEELNVFNAARIVLDDSSNTGDYIHGYIEDDLNDRFATEPVREDHVEMVDAYHDWRNSHDVRVIATEATVFGDGYAGTGDFWAEIACLHDGPTCTGASQRELVPLLVDTKSSRKLGLSHIGQLGAISACDTMAVEVPEGTPDAVYHKLTPAVAKVHGGQVDSWWVAKPTPVFVAHAVLQVRPGDFHRSTGAYIPPFCKLHLIPQEAIDAGYEYFRAGLQARIAERKMKPYLKED